MVAAGDHEWTVLRAAQWLAVADAAQGLAAGVDAARYFYAWRDSGLWSTINHLLLMSVRLAAGRQASPAPA
ncbi:transposase (fragment) [Mesorhizobium metallidurans STM 2683]|uniref:Transposase n=1 Tax=Mesorhizobium metallidurans STM 2683 TaxID=1297569 RepID=M5EMK2_9HYPH